MGIFHLPLFSISLLLTLLLLGVKLLQEVLTYIRDPLSSVPGPWYARWTDLPLKYLWLNGQRTEYVHGLHQVYGPIVRLSPSEVDISEPASARAIHRVGSTFKKGRFYDNLTTGQVVNVFSTTDVIKHRNLRRLLSSPLSDVSMKTVEPIVDALVRLTMQKMEAEAATRGVADVAKWFLFMATDVIGELSFGDSFRMVEQGKKNQYIFDLEGISALSGLRTTFPGLISKSRFLPLPIFKNVAAAASRMRQYADESIQRYKRLLAGNPTMAKTTLFTKLFDAGKEGLSDADIQAQAVAYIVAGSDTTANTLTYLVWEVCGHAEVKQSLLMELQTLPEDFNDEHLRALPYLQHVIEETLRLYSAVPAGLQREVPPQGAELGGYSFPGGFTVTTQAYTLHRDPVIFPGPEKFIPERWAQPTSDMKQTFMAFGGGSRICLGMHLARMELRLAVARFFLSFPHASRSRLEGMSEKDMTPRIYFLLAATGKRCLIDLH
ncbi:cytochrome P450 [Plectosphaerella plurivora]|uniref:Cytochrome P450 n=1 Tax=Plectosphaerella plurivora TaxID=936078 RepID=A0A9P8VFA6_9PEZI|nr:cytochrome P450 [Plectosphaerella plurivora]